MGDKLQPQLKIFEDEVRQIELNKKYQYDQGLLCKEILLLCKKYINRLESFFLDFCLKDVDNEIFFFKTLKPEIFSTFYFYQNKFNFENKIAHYSEDERKKMINKEIKKLGKVFKFYQNYNNYRKTKTTFLDDFYYRRCSLEDVVYQIKPEECMHKTDFHCVYGNVEVEFLKSEKLISYYKDKLSSKTENQMMMPFDNQLKWTAPKVGLTELCIALKESGAINNGDVSIAEIERKLLLICSTDGSIDTYGNSKDIKNRSKDYSRFTEKLKSSVVKFVENSYE